MQYTAPMHPPRVSTAEVRAVIRELMVGKTLPSGAAVRATLDARFGSRGGVAESIGSWPMSAGCSRRPQNPGALRHSSVNCRPCANERSGRRIAR